MTERYQEYLKSAEWKHLKSIKLKQSKPICQGCNESGRILEVHHLTYERIGMELLTDLVVYCRECHDKAHGKEKPSEWNMYLKQETDVKPKEKQLHEIEFQKYLDSI